LPQYKEHIKARYTQLWQATRYFVDR